MLLIGTTRGLRVLETGATFAEGASVTALAVGGPGVSYALLDRRRIVLVDGEAGDARPVGELPESDGQSLAVLADGTIVVGRSGAMLSLVGPRGEIRDVDAFQTVSGRDGWENPAGPTPDTRTMDAGDGRWWVNVHVGGVWWSGDVGQSWHPAVEPGADVHEVRAGTEGRVAVAAAVGFGWSEDDGQSWSWTTDGFHASYLRAVALEGDVAFVSASDGPFTRNGGVYRSRLGSGFVRCEAGLPDKFSGNVDSGRLDARGGHAALGFADRVYVSEDNGVTWRDTLIGDPITTVRFTAD